MPGFPLFVLIIPYGFDLSGDFVYTISPVSTTPYGATETPAKERPCNSI